MGMAGGIGDMIQGAFGIGMAGEEANAEHRASITQRDREIRAANAAIESAQQKGAFEAGRLRVMGTQLAAKQRTAYAASGVDATTGTAAAVQADTAALNELDAQSAAINAAREVWGYKEAKRQSNEEYANRQGGINRKQTGQFLGGMTKFGTGVAKIAGGGGG